MKIAATFQLLRPKQWVKNVFVFAPLILTQGYQRYEQVQGALLAFIAMCLLSSATYIANDLLDLERDRLHPKKSKRPLAAGIVSTQLAITIALILMASGLALAAYVNVGALKVGVAYLGLQVLYNFYLKKIPIADVFTLSTGFVLRALMGAVAIRVPVSVWLFLCTGAIALLLGFGKRRHEFVTQGEDRIRTREALGGYTLDTLNVLLIVASCAAVASYGLYSIESETAKQHKLLAFSSPFVLYGVCRYLMLVWQGEGGEPESLVLTDKHLITTFVLFTLSVIAALTLRAPGVLQ
jgi:4-hydroxybenzoate polyprenyltransferase